MHFLQNNELLSTAARSQPTGPGSAVSGSTCALARGGARLARHFALLRFIGGAPMKTAEAAVLPGTGGTVEAARRRRFSFASYP